MGDDSLTASKKDSPNTQLASKIATFNNVALSMFR